jgi:hypothetical protein
MRLGGGAALTVSGTAFEVTPPPAAKGLKTVTCSVAGVAMSDARIVAVSCSVLLYTVGRLLALICTTEFVRKPLPVTVNVKLGPPADTADGAMLVIVGGAGCAAARRHIPIKTRSKTAGKILRVYGG